MNWRGLPLSSVPRVEDRWARIHEGIGTCFGLRRVWTRLSSARWPTGRSFVPPIPARLPIPVIRAEADVDGVTPLVRGQPSDASPGSRWNEL